MVFAIYVCRIDTSFLQSSFNSFLNLFCFSLFNCNLDLCFFYRFRNTSFINSNRIHCSNLHSHIVSYFFIFFIESSNCTKLILTHVVVNSCISTFNYTVTIQLHLFTSDTATISNSVLYSTVTHR